jgi:hypothetical protein
MANLSFENAKSNFRYVRDIDSLDDSQLESHGYYRGYPCPHHHTIRDLNQHWCYHCAIKIKSNICGFNINLIHRYYHYKYERLWKKVEILDPKECWELNLPGSRSPKRINFPSYRAFYTGRASENVTPHKLIYQCAWGDVGAMTVTRICGNPWCGNPLHMVSNWNIGMPPSKITPLVLEFKPEFLMLMNKALRLGKEQEVIERYYRQTVRHPFFAPEPPDYDEG